MSELEFLRYAVLGQYLPRDSLIHRLDPRVKILAFLLIVLAVSWSNTIASNIVSAGAILFLIALSRVPLKQALQGIRPILPILAFLAVLQILLPPRSSGVCTPVVQWKSLALTDCTIRLIIVSTARLIELMVLTTLLTLTTTTNEVVYGVEGLLIPLQRIGIPAHEFALTVTIALRFIPTLALQLERIVKAQMARGADFGIHGRWRFVKTTRRLLPLLVPLFLVGLRRSEYLALAMEARGYTGGKGRTRRVRLHARPADYAALVASIAFCATMLVANL